MRSYEDGRYSLLADGNLNLMLHRIYNTDKSHNYTIIIPKNHVPEDLVTIKEKLVPMFECTIIFKEIDYGVNAEANRVLVPKKLAEEFETYTDYDKVISFFERFDCDIPWILQMSMSKIKELDRPYADKHFDALLDGLKHPMLIQCEVLNQAQIDEVARADTYLADNIRLNEKCINKELYDKMNDLFIRKELVDTLEEVMLEDSIFFPFRINDKAYDFDKVVFQGKPIVVTDPNRSLDGSVPNVLRLSGANMKELLFTTVEVIKNRPDIKIHIYEDCELAVHMLIVELCLALPEHIVGLDAKAVAERYTF